MDDRCSNPYASPASVPAAPERRRPLGAIACALLLWFYGVVLGVGLTIAFVVDCVERGLPPTFEFMVLALFIVLASSAVGAAIGLMSGRGWGWWAAVWCCYLTGAMFVLMPIIRTGIGHRAWFKILVGTVLVVLLLYLHKRNVLAFYSQMGWRRWPIHIGLLTLAVAVALGIGFR